MKEFIKTSVKPYRSVSIVFNYSGNALLNHTHYTDRESSPEQQLYMKSLWKTFPRRTLQL